MLEQNLIISLPTYPIFCWYATGTTHIFHLGLTTLLHLFLTFQCNVQIKYSNKV